MENCKTKKLDKSKLLSLNCNLAEKNWVGKLYLVRTKLQNTSDWYNNFIVKKKLIFIKANSSYEKNK